MGNYHKVDKGEFFIEEGKTLITETDSDRYLDVAAKRRRAKKKKIFIKSQKIVWNVTVEEQVGLMILLNVGMNK